MKKITWCTVARAPYLDYLHTEMSKHFDLKVYYKIRQRTHPWNLEAANFKQSNIYGNFIEAVKRTISSDILVISGWSYWQHLILMLIPLKKTKKIYWTDTPNLDPNEWSGLKGNIRRIIIFIVFRVFDEVWSTGVPGCEALEKLGCKKEKIKSFPFILDITRYDKIDDEKRISASHFKNNYTNKTTDIVFFSAGLIIPKKRFDNAVEALAFLKNERAILWIAGSGPEQNNLKNLADKLNVRNQVKFLGWLQEDEIELAFISSDVFVHPSYFDPFPTVILDAMTWGKPIIATEESGSARDRITQGINGFTYPSGRIDLLRNYLEYFVKNENNIKPFGAEAKKTASLYPIEWAINIFKNLC